MVQSSSPLSSPLSSVGSRSPTPPVDYPTPLSPPSSNTTGTPSTARVRDFHDHDEPPPTKRRRIMKSRDMRTEYLDLGIISDSDDEAHNNEQDEKLKKLMTALRTKRKIVVIAGAGISVAAGIPDFRSSDGLFTTLRTQHGLKSSGKHLFDASVYRTDSSTSSFHDMVRELSHLTQNAQPTVFHHMIATLAEEGRLLRLYSQNVDGIDTSLEPLRTTVPLNRKGPWPKTIQLHGGLDKMVCSKCGHLADFDGSLFEGPEPPSCPECELNDSLRVIGGLRSHGVGCLRPRMVLYNEYNPDEDAIGACSHADLKCRPDAVIVVGTSLKVPGIRRLAKEMCQVTRGRRDGFTAWINRDPEPVGAEFKDCWDMVVRGECDEVARITNLPRWNDKDTDELNSGEAARNSRPEVVLELKPRPPTVVKTEGILTPTGSPRHQSIALPPFDAPLKLKQPQLQFGGNKSILIANSQSNTKKKRGRKPLPGKPMIPTNMINSKFGATKTSKTASKKLAKPAGGDKNGAISLSLKMKDSSPMGPISPTDMRYNNDTSLQNAPESPKYIAVEIPAYTETISPKSVPKGMANLFT